MGAASDNGFGLNWALRSTEQTCIELGIESHHRVLEVGGAGNPFARANVVCDLTFGACAQRNGAPGVFRSDVTYVEAPVEHLPFADHEFDFVYCTQVLEHVLDPVLACRELSRVARRGFIEVPSRTGELINGNPTHRWIVDRDGDVLVFTPRPFVEHPLRNFFYGVLFRDAVLRELVEHDFRNLLNHQVVFDGTLTARITAGAPGFNYDNPADAARAHLSFAANALRAGADPQYAYPDALEASRLIPKDPAVLRLLALYQLRLLRPAEALATLQALGDPLSAVLQRTAQALLSGAACDPSALPVPEISTTLPTPTHRPRVTLVVTGTSAEDLRASVESALTQDHPDTEVVVAAALPLAAVLRGLEMGERLKSLELPADTSLGMCINRAAMLATGNHVGFVIAPARLMAHHAERLSGALLLSNAQVVASDVIVLDRGVIHIDVRPGNPELAALPLTSLLMTVEAALRCGPVADGAAESITAWLLKLVSQESVLAVRDASYKLPVLPDSGVHPLEAAEAALALKPLELLRDLMAAHVREEGLRARLRERRDGSA
ncbi:MAG: class I SAM-dependent methyltransferase [Planctomycetes bacterium]|nr:class I SAM-dependent methyltransferase [Planctomycetota bacterium]